MKDPSTRVWEGSIQVSPSGDGAGERAAAGRAEPGRSWLYGAVVTGEPW